MKPKLYIAILALVLGDVVTTYYSSILLGSYFRELGVIPNFLMSIMQRNWPLAMFTIELVIFTFIAFIFSRSKSSIKIGRQRLQLGYLPVIALTILVSNNFIHIVRFA